MPSLTPTTGSAVAPAGGPGRPPAAVGKYRVIQRLGAGGMGVVYLCAQPGLDRQVAVKVVALGSAGAMERLARFEREARAAAQLAHPNIVPIHDAGADGDHAFLVMEYVAGPSLDRLIGSKSLTVEFALRLTYQIAQALQAAHDRGIIHRDVKPSNILIDPAGRPRLADFGLAKSLDGGAALSTTGDLVGTPRYMSPEQVLYAPDQVDARTDVYSLGAVLYEMLVGRAPVDGPHPMAVLRRVTDEQPTPLRELCPDLPAEVIALCERAMAKDRDARFGSAGQFAEAIQNYLLGRLLGRSPADLLAPLPAVVGPVPRPSRRPIVLAGVGAAALVIGLVVYRLGVPAVDHSTGPPVESVAPSGPVEPAGGPAPASVLADVRVQLQSLPRMSDGRVARERTRLVLDDLTAYLKAHPDDVEALVLRAQAYRRGGECLAAVSDLNAILQRTPTDRAATAERLLATYQVYVLYLGNIDDPALRPEAVRQVREDVARLAAGTPAEKYLATLVDALAAHRYAAGVAAVESGARGPVPLQTMPDVAMVEADVLFHAAEEAFGAESAAADDESRVPVRRRREDLARRAVQSLRRGLDADPNHVGLLFLKANSLQMRAVWDTEGDDRPALFRRQKPAFETALDRLRHVTLRTGCDTPLARAVLLSNFGRRDPALDQLKDALSARPTVPFVHTFNAWVRLHEPTDGVLAPEEAELILKDLEPAFETPPDDFQPYLVRAILLARSGRWEAARRDLRDCRRRFARESLPGAGSTHPFETWYSRAVGPTPAFLDATLDVLWDTPVEVRARTAEELLKRLEDAEGLKGEGVSEADAKGLKGSCLIRLARIAAERDDKAGALRRVRAALELRLPDLTPEQVRADDLLKAWNEDPEFKAMYAAFEKKSDG